MEPRANSQYGIRPWMVNTPPAIPSRPNNYQNWLEDVALAPVNGEASEEQIRNMRPSSLPQISLDPPKFGYRTEALKIEDVASLDDLYERIDFTGRQSGYQGTSYPSLNQF